MMIDTLIRFENCPIVFFIGDDLNLSEVDKFTSATCFAADKITDCAQAIHAKIHEIKGTVNKVFD